ncbi:protein of unknown function [Pseudorhizobium banfieldiae]|uniref:Uncharacterized protein n=1 Tax=Pseudorhizobium banfieldiae TaxID=1125847 RepID=L0NIV5_9HYPH|nr:protein of unknown function [Pseudorhizobium banfieldiae]
MKNDNVDMARGR